VSGLGNETVSQFKQEFRKLIKAMSSPTVELKNMISILGQMGRVLAQRVVEKVAGAFMLAFDVWIGIIDRLLRHNIRLPFITDLYEKRACKGQCKMSVYDLMGLVSATPLTVKFKLLHQGRNLFTPAEAQVLISTENPEYYIDNLVSFAMQVPHQNMTALRLMYRVTTSHLLGAGYAVGQLLSAAVGFFSWADVTPVLRNELALYIFRAPFELMSILCNYPWSWYTETVTKVCPLET
jgi:hypothetical protein